MTYLNDLIPASRHDSGVLWAGAEANATDPLGVTVLGDVELAITQRVPQLNGAVTATRDNLTVVRAKANAQDITSVSHKAARRHAGVEVPETESLIPRGRQSKLTIRRDHDIRHEVVVTVQDLLWVAIVGVITRQLPNNDGLVTRSSQQKVWVLLRSSNGSNPALVARQATLVSERLRPESLLVLFQIYASLICDTHMSEGSRRC